MKTDNGPLLCALKSHWALPAAVKAGSNTAAILDTEVPMLRNLRNGPAGPCSGQHRILQHRQRLDGHWLIMSKEAVLPRVWKTPNHPGITRTLERDSLSSYADRKEGTAFLFSAESHAASTSLGEPCGPHHIQQVKQAAEIGVTPPNRERSFLSRCFLPSLPPRSGDQT